LCGILLPDERHVERGDQGVPLSCPRCKKLSKGLI
jgi:hypothetical protein